MNLTRTRERTLAVLGLTALVGCRGAEPTSPPTTTAGGATTAAPEATPAAPAPTTAPTAAPGATGAPVVSTTGAWVPAVEPEPPGKRRPGIGICPHGSFCVAGAGDACPATIPIPAGMGPVLSSRQPTVTHDAARTTAERPAHPGACCYQWHQLCVGGRALRGLDGPVTAETAGRDDWTAAGDGPRPQVDPTEAERAALAAYWEREAAFEHASVAAFARASLALLAVGAPADLLAGTHAAALDEIDHARLTYGLASRYGGAQRGPGPLPVHGALGTPSLAALAVETFLDGCAGEAVAALALREGAATTRDPGVRAILERIAEDEERHAELAWKTVAWALRAGGEEVARGLDEAMATLRAERAAGADERAADELDLSGYGALGEAARRSVRRQALAEVVLPCAEALLAAISRDTERHARSCLLPEM